MLCEGPPSRIGFATDIKCIENFPFKIPINKTYLFICSAISDALGFSIGSSSAISLVGGWRGKKSSCWTSEVV